MRSFLKIFLAAIALLLTHNSYAQLAIDLVGGAQIHSQKYTGLYGSGREVAMGGNLSLRGMYHTKHIEGGVMAETGRLVGQGYVMGGLMANALIQLNNTELYIGGMAGAQRYASNWNLIAGGQIGQRRELSPHLYFIAEVGARYADIAGGSTLVFPILVGLRIDFTKTKQL
jgi:hypothetical protein